jgi:hypothetical protein
MKLKIQIGDNDPWHLSWKPAAVTAFGALCFGLGAARFVLDGITVSRAALLVLGIACWAMAYRAAVRERLELAAALGAKEDAAIRADQQARDKGAV